MSREWPDSRSNCTSCSTRTPLLVYVLVTTTGWGKTALEKWNGDSYRNARVLYLSLQHASTIMCSMSRAWTKETFLRSANTTRVHGPWTWESNTGVILGTRVHGPRSRAPDQLPVNTARRHGPWTRVVCTEPKATAVTNTEYDPGWHESNTITFSSFVLTAVFQVNPGQPFPLGFIPPLVPEGNL